MSHTITVRLNKELAEWLAETSERTGVPQGRLVRDQLEKARMAGGQRPFMRWAGSIKGLPRDLSMRKGYSKGTKG
ncbi:MAG: ribbon-helix-helix domain-containing protein [Verrucomicrobiae bacterium]|nr:ribbon-helix-helix domain-containing protein [Verrucomicrobiae bacterium]